jgi:hypothetical protein
MEIIHKDFIGVYKNVYSSDYCQHLISEFERLADAGAGSNRQKSENALRHNKDDHHIFINIKNHTMLPFDGINPVDMFFDGLQNCYNDYTDRFSVLKTSGNIRGTVMKIQRTGLGGGYHVWHSEQGEGEQANRALVYMLYLNTLPEGGNGETEFLYQRLRFKPEENTMLLWPASYTHAHRGNPVYSEIPKYIVTGWFYYD